MWSATSAFWVVAIGFVSALGTTIIAVLRALTSGKIVVGRHYDEALRRELSWQKVAETAMQANTELSNHLGRLTVAMEQSTATTREALALARAPAIGPPQ